MDSHWDCDSNEMEVKPPGKRGPAVPKELSCGICHLKFVGAKLLEEHLQFHLCSHCGQTFLDKDKEHRTCHVTNEKQLGGSGLTVPRSIYTQISEAHRGTIASFQYKFTSNFVLLEQAYDAISGPLLDLVNAYLKHHTNIRVKLTFYLKLKELKTGMTINRYFNSPNFLITHQSFIEPIMEFLLNYIIGQLNLYHNQKSGYTLIGILENIVSFIAVKHTSVGSYLPMPKGLAGKKGYLSIKTKPPDDNCFILSVVNSKFSHMFKLAKCPETPFQKLTGNQRIQMRKQMENPKNYSSILAHVKRNNLLTLEPFQGPFRLCDLDYFEAVNKCAITIFGYNRQNSKVHPIRITTAQHQHKIALLMIKTNDLSKEQRKRYPNTNHFVLITDPSRFFCNKYPHKRLLCFYCANMITKPKFGEHTADCGNRSKLHMTFPTENVYKFTGHYKLMSMPYKLVVDIVQCLNTNLELTMRGYSIKGFGPEEEIVVDIVYFGPDCSEQLAFDLIEQARKLLWMQSINQIPLRLSLKDREAKMEATECPICECPFTSDNVCVSHHSHFVTQERYRDPNLPKNINYLCQKCNLALSVRNYILVVMNGFHKGVLHNLLGNMRKLKANVMVIPRKGEEFICLQVPNLFKTLELKNFVDEDLGEMVHQFNIDTYAQYFEHYNRLFEHDIGPYYFPSGSVFDCLDSNIPTSIDDFVDLNLGRDMEQKELDQVLQYCAKHNIQKLRVYAEHYLNFRIHAINSVVQALNRWALTNYNLSIHYDYSLAGFAWSSCMFNSKASFEYLKCPIITERILDNIIGGISHLACRYIKANSPRLGQIVQSDEERVEILCADLKGAYSYVMCDELPIGEYKLIEGSQLDNVDVWKLANDPNYAHFLNVDLLYPAGIKAESSDLPYCPEKLFIDPASLAEHHRGVYEEMKSTSSTMKNVIITQSTKKGVLLHQRMLYWYLKRGLKLAKIHYMIRFRQSAWLKSHVERCIALRHQAKNDIEKRLVKSTINMIYGKAYGGMEMYSIRFCDSAERCKKLAALPDFYDGRILNNDLSVFYIKKKARMFDKNLCLALAVLQLSHLNFYSKVYKLKDYFGSRLYTAAGETDSCVCIVKDPNASFIQDLKNLEEIFDFSNLGIDSPLYSTKNASRFGIFQIEHEYAVEFVKLKSKNYAIKSLCKTCKLNTFTTGNDICSLCNVSVAVVKGAPKNVFCPFSFYLSALRNESKYVCEYYSLKTKNERIQLSKINRTILAVQDFRRKWSPDSITSVPFGYEEDDTE